MVHQDYEQAFSLNPAKVSIEHIEPQANRSTSTRRNAWVFSVGNLMLLPKEINNSLPSSFSDKRGILKGYVFTEEDPLHEAIENDVWNSDQSRKREEWISDKAIEIWKVRR